MLNKLTEIIRNETGDTSIILTRENTLTGDLGLNSLDLVNLACTIEDNFDIDIPDRAIKDFKTVGDVIDFISNNEMV